MLRSRKSRDSDTDDDNGKGANVPIQISTSPRTSSPPNPEPIVPTWILCVTVAFFLFLGFSSEHYQRSRDADHFHVASVGGAHDVNIHKDDLEHGFHKVPDHLIGKSMLSFREDEQLEYDDTNQRYHVIFSTDCSPYQHWQSYLVYFTAMKVRQPGHVTRIVSGCTPKEAVEMTKWFNEKVQFMSQRFHLHLTPKFSEVRDETGKVVGDYKFFNKPRGLKHWLEYFDLMGFDEDAGTFEHEDDIVILIDPDMSLMRPITKDFSKERETLISTRRQQGHVLSKEVKHGVPFAQTYGLGTQWQKFDLDKIAGEHSPAKDVSKAEGQLYYPAGPPYIGTVKDMYQIALKWSEFVPLVHAQYPYLLAEMYAYCIAAAHLGLKHQLIDSLMASNPDIGGEAWPLVDIIPPEEMCEFAKDPDNDKYALPSVVHMCQRYSVGQDWFFGKRRIPSDIYECDTPLFEEPPKDLALKYDYKWPPNAKEKTPLSPMLINEQTFMVCYLTRLLNDAAIFYKSAACTDRKPNMNRSRKVADLFKEREKQP
jgi:peptidyl serine alpha-galactosyltransferase